MSAKSTLIGMCVRMQQGNTLLTLDPAHSGAIREFTWCGKQILRSAFPLDNDDPFELACFPLVPFANRIANGRFEFDGRSVSIAPNSNRSVHPLHGQGWLAPWETAAAAPSSATLVFDGGGDEWPWRYRAQQKFELEDGALKVELSVQNRADTAMPAMLGLHPYFFDAAHARLQAETPRVWLADAACLPLEEAASPATWRFDRARPVNAAALDHCFTRWNGVATISWPDRAVLIHARNCSYLHIYTPSGQEFFCVEPQTAPVGALNRDCHETKILQPGDSLAMEVTFEVGES